MGGNLPSNAGDPADTLRAALDALTQAGAQVQAVSGFYQTPCFPAGAGPDYVNAAARISCDGTAAQVLTILHNVEAIFGRERVQRWGRRTLDLDLIAAGDLVLPDRRVHAEWRDLPPDQQTRIAPDQLILPHPRVQDRGFVLIPLADIAPQWCHPVLGVTVRQMVGALPPEARKEVIRL
ncbi:2-amino-4-hydroxy-6-hydroxymethyldihydropteridine diphosphokinase [Rhodobacteraceae bacterium KMM 6894]|nr:2-amino-4-hydroxy-6-hydroxymethyldihydropteridine diphosphokinase [Rhodobacteraceae bacterium KMM 6894]